MGSVISFLVTKLADNRIYFAVIIFPLILCLLTYINQLIKIIVFGVDQQKNGERK